jgi:putative ABC transport system permease protein
MSILDIILTAIANMRRNKARTILTVLAIFIGATTLTLTNGIGNGIKAYLNKQVGNLGSTSTMEIQAINSTSSLISPNTPTKYDPSKKVVGTQDRGPGSSRTVMTQKDIDNIKKDQYIIDVLPGRTLSPDYIVFNNTTKYQLPMSQAYGVVNNDIESGRNVNNSDSDNEITIPVSFVSPLGLANNTQAINKIIDVGVSNSLGGLVEIQAKIVGVQNIAFIGTATSYANTALANAVYSAQSYGIPSAASDQYSFVVARFQDNLSQTQISSLKQDLVSQGYSGQTIQDTVSTVFSVINAIIVIFDMFGIIALIAASFGIVNTLLMSVQERTKEIGLMKALGMSPKRIFLLFSSEAILIGLFGSFLGVGFAETAGSFINTFTSHGFLKNFNGLSLLSFPARIELLTILGIMAIAFLAGTLPAYRASKKDPIEALRYE